MTDTVTREPPAASHEGPNLRRLLVNPNHHHHDESTIITGMNQAPPQLDISTTTAAVAAAQEAQLRDVAGQDKHQSARFDHGGLIIQTTSNQQPPSPHTPVMESHHQHSPAVVPEGGMDDHEAAMSPTGDLGPPAQICLCQQPARIPRPRNAFILFRQHNHAQVVQQNPGKPNPEISKIIGEMWRESSKETKQLWQRHADEEKRQHLQRFPEYRYQPRRNGKKAAGLASLGLPGASNSVESAVCPICGGRTGALATPTTPATPISASSKTFRHTYMPTPKTPSFAPVPASARRKRTEDDSRVRVEALLSLGLPEHQEEDSQPPKPPQLAKKRRLNGLSPTTTTTIITAESVADALETPRTAKHPMTFNPDPNIDPFLKQTGIHCSFGSPESPPPAISNDKDRIENLLQLSIEDFVRYVPAIDKLRALTRICKPLPTPEDLPCLSPRGAIVAIEGEDIVAVKALCEALADTLKPEMVEILSVGDEIDGPIGSDEKRRDTGVQSTKSMSSAQDFQQRISGDFRSLEDHFLNDDSVKATRYLQSIAHWRLRCNAMKRTVTSQYPPSSQTRPENLSSHSQPTGSSPLLRVPIILLNRYILSRIDSAARKLANTDGLTPSQHWQWAASIWRGCVGPDMTILVKTEAEPSGADPVEVKENGKFLIVRKDAKKEWDGGRVRRLGFEVNECVRMLQGIS